MTYNAVKIMDVGMLDYLYENSALTFEGASPDDGNMQFLVDWLEKIGCVKPSETALTIYNVSGKMMNDHYNLTGRNRYKARLNLMCVDLKDLDNIGTLAIQRFSLGGRWFDDIVDNNARREGYDG